MRWIVALCLVGCGDGIPSGSYTLKHTPVVAVCSSTLPAMSKLEIFSTTYVQLDGHEATAVIEPARSRDEGPANVQFSLAYSEMVCCFEGRPFTINRMKQYQLWGDDHLEGDASGFASGSTCSYTVTSD